MTLPILIELKWTKPGKYLRISRSKIGLRMWGKGLFYSTYTNKIIQNARNIWGFWNLYSLFFHTPFPREYTTYSFLISTSLFNSFHCRLSNLPFFLHIFKKKKKNETRFIKLSFSPNFIQIKTSNYNIWIRLQCLDNLFSFLFGWKGMYSFFYFSPLYSGFTCLLMIL